MLSAWSSSSAADLAAAYGDVQIQRVARRGWTHTLPRGGAWLGRSRGAAGRGVCGQWLRAPRIAKVVLAGLVGLVLLHMWRVQPSMGKSPVPLPPSGGWAGALALVRGALTDKMAIRLMVDGGGMDASPPLATPTGRALHHTNGSADASDCWLLSRGRDLVVDSRGGVCRREALAHSEATCCPAAAAATADGTQQNASWPLHSCTGCDPTAHCCAHYEHCVACCMGPEQVRPAALASPPHWRRRRTGTAAALAPLLLLLTVVQRALIASVRRHATHPAYTQAPTVADFCLFKCRTSSASLVHQNTYAGPLRHCYGPFGAPQPREGVRTQNSDGSLLRPRNVWGSVGLPDGTILSRQGVRLRLPPYRCVCARWPARRAPARARV